MFLTLCIFTTEGTKKNNNNNDALCLLRNALAMPKLLYILRTAPYTGNKLLKVFADTLRKGLTSILNVDISDDQ